MPPIRKECPPGACICAREQLLSQEGGDTRVLLLTREEEQKLLSRLERISSLADLRHMQARLYDQLGVVLHVQPGPNEVRTVMGLQIEVEERPGLCRKVRKSIPTAIRRCLEANLDIVFEMLNENDLFGMSQNDTP